MTIGPIARFKKSRISPDISSDTLVVMLEPGSDGVARITESLFVFVMFLRVCPYFRWSISLHAY
ncbi:MAG: hypothetical protein GY729_09115 [Desulfobacteraceae bacterium]|nr:hypothetical protein [Desulfobacteraceae bacterium]